jgi:transposase
MPPSAVLLFEDETVLRLFPVLRRAWSAKGEQGVVAIRGRNAKRVLFGVINVHTGHRIVKHYNNMQQENFQDFLHLLRRSYRNRPVWILLDKAGGHTTPRSTALAKTLNIELIWLPKQCSELNGMDHLWKQVKSNVSANYQFVNIDEHTAAAEKYIMSLTNCQAKTKAGLLSKNFWLRHL